jgi:type II secretory pathway pseudopilin PulG
MIVRGTFSTQRHHRARPRRSRRRSRGFTLIEAALTTAITGIAFVAIMELFSACTQQNRIGSNMTTAMLLAGHVQETMAGLQFNDPVVGRANFGPEGGQNLNSYDDIDDFDGQNLNPPIDALRRRIPELSQFTQSVIVMPIYPTQLSSNSDPASPAIPRTAYTGTARVTVRILYRKSATDAPIEIFRTSWIRVDQ